MAKEGVLEESRVRVTLSGEDAAYVQSLAERYGVSKVQVTRLLLECVRNPDGGTIEERLAELVRAREEERLAAERGEPGHDVEASHSTSEDRLEKALQELREMVLLLAEKISAQENPGRLRQRFWKGGAPAEALPESHEDLLPPPNLEDADFIDLPDLSASMDAIHEGFAGVDAAAGPVSANPAPKPSLAEETLQHILSRIDTMAEDLSSLSGGQVNAVVTQGIANLQEAVQEVLRTLQEMQPTPASAPVGPDDFREMLESSLEGVKSSINGLVDAMATQLPSVLAGAVVEALPGREAVAPSVDLTETHDRLTGIGKVVGEMAAQLDAFPALAERIAQIEDRVSRANSSLSGLVAEMQRLGADRGDDQRLAGLEEKMDHLTSLLEALVEESSKSFVLQPSKGFGKKFVGQLRLIKEE